MTQVRQAKSIQPRALRIDREHYGLAVYQKPNGELWAVGSGKQIDRAVESYIRDQLTCKSRAELLARYEPMAPHDALVQSQTLDVIDASIERLMRWAVKRDPGTYLGGRKAAPKPRIAVVEGLPSGFAIRID